MSAGGDDDDWTDRKGPSFRAAIGGRFLSNPIKKAAKKKASRKRSKRKAAKKRAKK